MKSKKIKSNFFFDFLVAGISASVGKTFTAPIERTKLLLQNQQNLEVIEVKYKGTIDCLTRLVKEEGFLSLWKGNATNIIRYFPTQALNFAFKDTFRNIFPKYDSKKHFFKFLLTNCASGGLAATLSMLVCQPIEVVRTRLTTDNLNSKGNRKFKGAIDCFRKVYKVEGFRGIYNGCLISCIGIFPYRASYFGLYDTVKSKYLKDSNSFLFKWAVAQSITIFSGLCFYPLDTLRRRIMVESGKPAHLKKYKGSLDCFLTIYREEGYFALYKGYGTNIIRTLGSSAVLVLYDEFQKLLGIEPRGKAK